ncbi:MAG: NADH-quinone oxidoreductase subunit C [Candidatus Omnitrophota bacterium]
MHTAEIFGLIKLKIPQAIREDETKAIVIPKDALLEAAHILINKPLLFDNLHCITAVERKEDMELVYHLYSMQKHQNITLKARLAFDELEIETLTKLWKSADWLEREVYDLMGVKFLNHPDLRRILNPDGWKVHPLRKDFSHPDFVKKPRY